MVLVRRRKWTLLVAVTVTVVVGMVIMAVAMSVIVSVFPRSPAHKIMRSVLAKIREQLGHAVQTPRLGTLRSTTTTARLFQFTYN